MARLAQDPLTQVGRPAMQIGIMMMTVILTGFALYAMRSILTPFALAIFLLLMIDGLARALVKRAPNFPPQLALPAAIILIVVTFALAIWAIAVNAGQFAKEAPAYSSRLDVLLQQVADRFGLETAPTVHELFTEINPSRYVGAIATALRRIGEGAAFTLVYLGFLLVSGQGFAAKARQLFPNAQERGEADRLFNHVRSGIESYMWVQTIIGGIIAACAAAIMLALGLHHALFFALLIFLASYIPIVGSAVAVLIPPLFGFMEFNELWRPVALFILLEAAHFAVSHVLLPRMQGKNLNVDPVVVLAALAFWGLIWGVAGAFLSTPLTVMAMAILAEFSGARWIAVLLSGDGKPYADPAELPIS